MHDGPHEEGPASYPVGDAESGFTTLVSNMTVPKLPEKTDGITYYIWTDIFFGDESNGRMNQFVPQLMLGNPLDGSTGYPDYQPKWHMHDKWAFGSHYFFEVYNETSKKRDAHAAYGELFPAVEGETLYTAFEGPWLELRGHPGRSVASSMRSPVRFVGVDLPGLIQASPGPFGPSWTLTMGVIGDTSRTSRLVVDQPYMGIGAKWSVPTTSWSELNYTNMCINACWELYNAVDREHLPGSGSSYNLLITQGSDVPRFPWVTKWDEDEGGDKPCPASVVSESHNATAQLVRWDVFYPPDASAVFV